MGGSDRCTVAGDQHELVHAAPCRPAITAGASGRISLQQAITPIDDGRA
jgi:hypothetical protein